MRKALLRRVADESASDWLCSHRIEIKRPPHGLIDNLCHPAVALDQPGAVYCSRGRSSTFISPAGARGTAHNSIGCLSIRYRRVSQVCQVRLMLMDMTSGTLRLINLASGVACTVSAAFKCSDKARLAVLIAAACRAFCSDKVR